MPKREPNLRGEGEQLREQLVAAASDLLLTTQAIALPSLRAVARACNVSPAAVYLHFDSQQALIQAVIDAHLAGLRAHIESSIPASGGPEEQLAAFGLGYAEWALAKPGAYQLLFESGDALPMPAHAGPSEDSDRWYLLTRAGELLAAAYGLDASSAQLGAVRIWAAMHGIVSLRIHKTELDWPPIDGEVGHLIATYRATRLA